ncbi:aldo/keto reductase [Colidextribacter sp. 210702-DFI.3.9]|nr:aldo/keto reductase [Colidextribacter sp. 210702-DFI.3.9]MCG4469533.1 aldo/keto reductase [Lawsonibacter sp. DFI.6.74]MCG4773594.1 aldo/keto reductase [Lawsonibacter sp. DFI.5.51]
MNIKTITLAAGDIVPALGQGTWYLGDDPAKRAQEVSALRTGMGAGMRLIDTAEMYGDGRSEKLVGEAIAAAPREELFLVSKVLPENAGEKHIFQCCDATMNRMGVDYLDLYLLHWRGSVPLAETVRCLEQLKELGKIKNWGVSNFDIGDMEELWRIPGGRNCQVNQVLYHMGSRGIEYSLLPWMREHRVALMAYCPLAQGGALRRGLLTDPAVLAVAEKHRATPIQVLLAWCIRDGNTIAIPRTGHPDHTLENAGANALLLDEEDLALIDRQYAPPTRKMPLDEQ